jgi:hypothetical protein
MPCKAVIEVVPAESACNGSASDLRYRLLMSALTDSSQSDTSVAVATAGEAAADAPVPVAKRVRR